jgi:hypothetical protein
VAHQARKVKDGLATDQSGEPDESAGGDQA